MTETRRWRAGTSVLLSSFVLVASGSSLVGWSQPADGSVHRLLLVVAAFAFVVGTTAAALGVFVLARRRWLGMTFASLIVGAALNVAVAVGCAFAGQQGMRMNSTWMQEGPNLIGSTSSFGFDFHLECSLLDIDGTTRVFAYGHTAERYRAGLPLRAFEGASYHSDSSQRAPIDEHVVEIRMGSAAPILKRYSIPTRPRPLELAVNTLTWGAIAWLVAFGPGEVRRWKRSRRGACVSCGYPLDGDARCPECGSDIS
ncbi:MAG: hypothetical protein KDA28_08240 [Phycisphaerales bacterium]|nr:hypothetical protein [Phycisphaerales bacterium]